MGKSLKGRNMRILLQKGDYLWTKKGKHICDEVGIAVKAQQTTEVEIDDEHLSRVIPILRQMRRSEGLIEEFGIQHFCDY